MPVDVVIFGGSGFIGSNLAEHFNDNGYKVRIADISPPKRKINGKVDFQRCNIVEQDSVAKCLSDANVAINTAIIQIPKINEDTRLGYEVNVIGTQNICESIYRNDTTLGMIQAGTWHTIGEIGLSGIIDESYGYRPDKVEERAKLYALSKTIQETIVRYYGYMSRGKKYIIIRSGTVLGEDMPEATAANIFINNAIKGNPITPYQHSMYRPMLYIDIEDLCKAYEKITQKILNGEINNHEIYNIVYPTPITVIELAELIKKDSRRRNQQKDITRN